jgi:hypothetical protein
VVISTEPATLETKLDRATHKSEIPEKNRKSPFTGSETDRTAHLAKGADILCVTPCFCMHAAKLNPVMNKNIVGSKNEAAASSAVSIPEATVRGTSAREVT